MNSNAEENSELCVACSDSSPVFEGGEDDFNEIFRSLLRKTGGAGDLFPRIRKDFKEKSSIPRCLQRGFFISCLPFYLFPLFSSHCLAQSDICTYYLDKDLYTTYITAGEKW